MAGAGESVERRRYPREQLRRGHEAPAGPPAPAPALTSRPRRRTPWDGHLRRSAGTGTRLDLTG